MLLRRIIVLLGILLCFVGSVYGGGGLTNADICDSFIDSIDYWEGECYDNEPYSDLPPGLFAKIRYYCDLEAYENSPSTQGPDEGFLSDEQRTYIGLDENDELVCLGYYYCPDYVPPGGWAFVAFSQDSRTSATIRLQDGDTDGDVDVDQPDFLTLSANYGTTSGATQADGDFDGDGDVDFSDYLALSENFGAINNDGVVDVPCDTSVATPPCPFNKGKLKGKKVCPLPNGVKMYGNPQSAQSAAHGATMVGLAHGLAAEMNGGSPRFNAADWMTLHTSWDTAMGVKLVKNANKPDVIAIEFDDCKASGYEVPHPGDLTRAKIYNLMKKMAIDRKKLKVVAKTATLDVRGELAIVPLYKSAKLSADKCSATGYTHNRADWIVFATACQDLNAHWKFLLDNKNWSALSTSNKNKITQAMVDKLCKP